MEMLQSAEIDPMQVTPLITKELGFGYGKIDAPNLTDEEAELVVREAVKYLREVSSDAPTGCMDGRPVIKDLSGSTESKLGPKLPGGEPITLLTAAELDDYFMDQGSISEHFSRIVWLQEKSGSPVRFHIDSDHEEGIKFAINDYRERTKEMLDDNEVFKVIELVAALYIKEGTGCGANDQFYDALSNLANIPRKWIDKETGLENIETDEQVALRLKANRLIQQAVLGDEFSEETFERHVARATELVGREDVKNWNSIQALMIADYVLRRTDSRADIFDRTQVVQAGHQGVHGHEEDIILGNMIPGTTIDSTAYYNETGEQAFVVDFWKPMDTIKKGLAENPDQQRDLNQGSIAAASNTTIQLTTGNHRVGVLAR